MSSDPEIRRDAPGARHGGHGSPLPAFLAPPAHRGGPPAPRLMMVEGWITGVPAPRAPSSGPLADPPSASGGRSPFPIEAIEID